jgi:hypothetical protein
MVLDQSCNSILSRLRRYEPALIGFDRAESFLGGTVGSTTSNKVANTFELPVELIEIVTKSWWKSTESVSWTFGRMNKWTMSRIETILILRCIVIDRREGRINFWQCAQPNAPDCLICYGNITSILLDFATSERNQMKTWVNLIDKLMCSNFLAKYPNSREN